MLQPALASEASPPLAAPSRLFWFFTLLGDAAGHSLQVEQNYRVKPLIPVDLAVPRCELQRVYQAHGQAVYRLAMTLLRNPAAAEDLAHDVFLRFWTSGRFDPNRGSEHTYLLTLTRSMALDQLGQRSNRTCILQRWRHFFDRTTASGEEQLQRNEQLAAIQLAMAQLPAAQQQVIELCYVQGFSHQAAAQRLGLPLGTLKTHARRGLLTLRKKLISQGGGN